MGSVSRGGGVRHQKLTPDNWDKLFYTKIE